MNNIVPKLHRIFSVHKLHYDIKHNTISIFKVGDKVLKSNARNRHRMGGKLEKPWLGVYIIQKDLGKGRYCLKTLEGKPLKQTIHCAHLKRYLDPVVDDNIVDEVEELDNSAGEQEAANGKGMGDNFHHDENDNDKDQGCQNEEQQSHSPEQRLSGDVLYPILVSPSTLFLLSRLLYPAFLVRGDSALPPLALCAIQALLTTALYINTLVIFIGPQEKVINFQSGFFGLVFNKNPS